MFIIDRLTIILSLMCGCVNVRMFNVCVSLMYVIHVCWMCVMCVCFFVYMCLYDLCMMFVMWVSDVCNVCV